MNCKVASKFNYKSEPTKAKVVALFKDGNKVDSLDDEGEVILDETNFYAESGGQVADTGVIENDNMSAKVTNVNKAPNKQHLHSVKVMFGELKVGDEVTAKIDEYRRALIARNHSSVHLLQQALTEVLGDHLLLKVLKIWQKYWIFLFLNF